LPVTLADEPKTCVVLGTAAYLEELDKLKKKKR